MKLQQLAEEKVGVLIVFTLLVVSVGLLIEASRCSSPRQLLNLRQA